MGLEMKVRRLTDRDQEPLDAFLSDHAKTSMFLRSNSRVSGLDYADREYHGEYFAAFDRQGRICGVLAHFWNRIVIMQSPDRAILADLIAAFQGAVRRPVAGVIGPDEQADGVIRALGLRGADFAVNRTERLYALELDRLSLPPHRGEDRMRMVTAGEVDRRVLTGWIRGHEVEALGSADDPALDAVVAARVDRSVQDGDCWALIADDRPVSLCGFNARLADMVQIGPVWTPPECRGRGYARMLVALTLQQAGREGVQTAILFTDSPAAANAYRAIGFAEVGTYRLALLATPAEVALNRFQARTP